ncbi:MAG: hypothetical protein K5927_07520 [Lachnospiraceae bacterium]|nr:hypothetical protein [Lachnospiraceae bacterium]
MKQKLSNEQIFFQKAIKFCLSEVLIFAMIMSLFCTSHADEIISSKTNTSFQSVASLVDELSQELYNDLKDADGNYKEKTFQGVKSRKTLRDFAGNTYVLAEFNKYGYIIIDTVTGTYIEGSLTSPSPYADLDSNLYYAGPNEYYVKNRNSYIYTINSEPIAIETINSLVVSSNAMRKGLDDAHDKEKDNITPGTRGSWAFINGYKYFQNLRDCGYCEVNSAGQKVSSGGSGICGYIAAGMLLSYDTVINHRGLVPSSYLSSDGTKYSIKSTLPFSLYRVGKGLGYSTSTTSVEIHYTVEKYLANMHKSVNHVSYYPPFANNSTVASYLLDDRPVIYFGAIVGAEMHAAVVYGYKMSVGGYSYMAHMGWNGHNAVSFTGALASMYTYT